jgi:hypothetical protein
VSKYYFQELCSHIQDDLTKCALEKAGHYQHNLPARQDLLEDIDDFINRHNHTQTIPEWYETVQQYTPWQQTGKKKGDKVTDTTTKCTS